MYSAGEEITVNPRMTLSGEYDHETIGFNNAHFSWSNDVEDLTSAGSHRREFILRVDGKLSFEQGKINLILGPTGSGKTSILMALLGMFRLSHHSDEFLMKEHR